MSSAYVADLNEQVARYGAWMNTYAYSVPVYTVGPEQRRVPVTLDTSGGSADLLARVLRSGVPIPPGAKPAAGSDASMVVEQPATNSLWELWEAHDENGVWHARWGGKMNDVSGSPGYYTNPSDWGGSGTSLSLLGGLIRISELRAGRIDHALALAIPHAAARIFAFPAQRTDGNDPNPNQIPEGTRFRLPASLNVEALKLPPVVRMIALAAQRYGIIVRDQSGAVAFYGEDPTPTGTNPYYGAHGFFGGSGPAQLLRTFPWRDLEVLRPRSVTR
jgi:hypothetical protein